MHEMKNWLMTGRTSYPVSEALKIEHVWAMETGAVSICMTSRGMIPMMDSNKGSSCNCLLAMGQWVTVEHLGPDRYEDGL